MPRAQPTSMVLLIRCQRSLDSVVIREENSPDGNFSSNKLFLVHLTSPFSTLTEERSCVCASIYYQHPAPRLPRRRHTWHKRTDVTRGPEAFNMSVSKSQKIRPSHFWKQNQEVIWTQASKIIWFDLLSLQMRTPRPIRIKRLTNTRFRTPRSELIPHGNVCQLN